MARLKGRTALVIGSATGIGRAVAQAFAAEGAVLVIADKGQAAEKAVQVQDIEAAGGRAIACDCDVTVEADVRDAITAAADYGAGRLDILVNNAGIGLPMTDFIDMEWNDWQRVLDVNLRGVAWGMRHALPVMLEQRYGRIINTASQLAHKPAAQAAAYSASKAAVVALSTAVAQEVAADFVELRFSLGTVEFEFDKLADPGGFHRGQAMMMDGIAHRHALWIEHTLFRQHDDFGFHKGGHPMKHPPLCQRDF